MIAPDPTLLNAAIRIMQNCPVQFGFDIVMMPSKDMDMVENPTVRDASWVGIVIYENDILTRPEPDRVKIGMALKASRDLIRTNGYRCEYFPLPGIRSDYNLDNGIPILRTQTSLGDNPK